MYKLLVVSLVLLSGCTALDKQRSYSIDCRECEVKIEMEVEKENLEVKGI